MNHQTSLAKIAIVVSPFNSEITSELQKNCILHLNAKGISSTNHQVFNVPGAIEIPFIAQQCAKATSHGNRQYAGIIALGAIIRGETSHFDYVCQQVSYGCQRVMLDEQIPIIFGVITCENYQQAKYRSSAKHKNLGAQSVDSLLHMLQLREKINAE